MSAGQAGDKVMYRDDNGKRVKLDVAGKPYPVGADGWRVGKASSRPAGMDPAQWAMLRPILIREGKTYEEYLAEVPKVNKDVQPAAVAKPQIEVAQNSSSFTMLEIFAGSARIV